MRFLILILCFPFAIFGQQIVGLGLGQNHLIGDLDHKQISNFHASVNYSHGFHKGFFCDFSFNSGQISGQHTIPLPVQDAGFGLQHFSNVLDEGYWAPNFKT